MDKLTLPEKVVFIAVMFGTLLIATVNIARTEIVVSDPYNNESFLALPDLVSGGPDANAHRLVLYNHGGMGSQEGGDLPNTVKALAEEGFIAYAKKRSGISISQTLVEVQHGIDELLDLTPSMLNGRSILSGAADPGVSIIGYSRGGLMALRVAELQATTTRSSVKIDKVIIQAAAPGGNISYPGTSGKWIDGGAVDPEDFTTMDEYLRNGSGGGDNNIGMINADTAEFFLQAANNDQPTDNPNNNLVDLVTTVHQRLTDRDVTSSLKIYDNWMSPESGHQLFERVIDGGQDLRNQPGYYFHDVIRHLNGDPITESTVLIVEPGDFNHDGIVDAVDIDLLRIAINTSSTDPTYDVNGGGLDSTDFDYQVETIIGSVFGDAELDKQVTFADFVSVSNNFSSSGTGWGQGNFNLDEITNFEDFVLLANNYGINLSSGIPAPISTPEPASLIMLFLAIGFWGWRQRMNAR